MCVCGMYTFNPQNVMVMTYWKSGWEISVPKETRKCLFPKVVFVHRGNMVFGKKKGGLWSLLTRGLYSEWTYRVISLGGGGGGGGGGGLWAVFVGRGSLFGGGLSVRFDSISFLCAFKHTCIHVHMWELCRERCWRYFQPSVFDYGLERIKTQQHPYLHIS